MNWLIVLTELVGTAAFAASGAMTGIRKRMDLLGVILLAEVTAVGGGILRDAMLGVAPPAAFSSPRDLLVALAAAVAMFCGWGLYVSHPRRLFDGVMFWMDTLGLAAFTVLGLQAAVAARQEQPVLMVFVAVLTGCGGGVLRDVLAGDRPYIFMKHIYATASLAGALVCLAVRQAGQEAGALSGMAVVILIRCLSSRFRWNLPHAVQTGQAAGPDRLCLCTASLARSVEFYRDALGFSLLRQDRAGQAELERGSLRLELRQGRPDPFPSGCLRLPVADVSTARQRHEAMGLPCAGGPEGYCIHDPDGREIALYPRKSDTNPI